MSKRPREEGEDRLWHIKITFCSKVADYLEEWIAEVFEKDQKLLCVFETGKNGSKHWHVQGTTKLTDKQLERKRAKLTARHGLIAERDRQAATGAKTGTPHVTSVSTKEVNATGHQYMMKRGSSVVHANGFSSEDLETLMTASDEYVEKIKHNVAWYAETYVQEFPMPKKAESMPRYVLRGSMEIVKRMKRDGERVSKRHHRIDLLEALAAQAPTEEVEEYLHCEIYGFKHHA